MSEMKKTFNITAFNAKGESVEMQVEVSHFKEHFLNRYEATIVASSKEIVLGEMPTGYYGEIAVSKIEPKALLTFQFGSGEINRQRTYPFVVYLKDSDKNKKDRLFFKFPVKNRSELRLMFIEE